MPVVASEGVARQQDEVLAAWKRDLEAARYAAQRAQKQYDAADPENRLVADELERRWNQTMSAALLARVGSVFADVNHQGIESQRASDSSPGPKRLFKTEVLGIEITVERIEMGDRCRLRMGQVPPADTDHPSCPSEPTTERFGVARCLPPMGALEIAMPRHRLEIDRDKLRAAIRNRGPVAAST